MTIQIFPGMPNGSLSGHILSEEPRNLFPSVTGNKKVMNCIKIRPNVSPEGIKHFSVSSSENGESFRGEFH